MLPNVFRPPGHHYEWARAHRKVRGHRNATDMIEGHIESPAPDGTVLGWIRDTDSDAPCRVQVHHAGALVAEAMATRFRADLLRGGHGHGHFGFAARLRSLLPPGPCTLALHLPRYDRTASMALLVPPLRPAAPVPVESLIEVPASWTRDDLLARPDCLNAAGHYRGLGAPRFVDALFRFVLERWPSLAEAQLHVDNLLRKRVDADDLLIDLLRCPERADLLTPLASPYDPIFPFRSILPFGHAALAAAP